MNDRKYLYGLRSICDELYDQIHSENVDLRHVLKLLAQFRHFARKSTDIDDLVFLSILCAGSVNVWTRGCWNSLKINDIQEVDLYIRDLVSWSDYHIHEVLEKQKEA